MSSSLLRNPRVLGAALAVVVAGLVAGLIVYLPGGDTADPVERLYPTQEPTATTAGATSTATPTVRSVLQPTPTAVPTPPVYIAPITRLRIPSLDVDAAVQVKGIDAANRMEDPDGPEAVAWYDFTSKPGLGAGNAVFSGHVDYINYGKAVFGDVSKLVEGDIVEVVLDDGTVVQFSVTASQLYDVQTIPMEEVLASTSTESVTLITCGGRFSQGAYSHRLVVRAMRTGLVPGTS